MPNKKSTAGYGILELVLVFVLIALLVTFGASDCSGKIAKKKTTHTEMSTIQAAFRRCYDDCRLGDDDMALFARFGLWPLAQNTAPTIAAIPPRPDRPGGLADDDLAPFSELLEKKLTRNWRGPYLKCNAMQAFSVSPINIGQDFSGNDATPSDVRTLPVQTDTWSAEYNPDKSRNLSYYRIIIPIASDGSPCPGDIALVCTGPNGKLDTQPADIDPATHDLVAQKDDIVLRLLPRRQ